MRTAANERRQKRQRQFTARMIAEEKRERNVLGMKKRTRITVVTRQTVVARQLRVRCQQCGAEVPIVTAENAAGVLQTTPQEIHGLLVSGELHAVEEPSGTSLICGNSLFVATEPEPGAVATGSPKPPAIAGESSLIEGERQ
jgi:hypothetical protein